MADIAKEPKLELTEMDAPDEESAGAGAAAATGDGGADDDGSPKESKSGDMTVVTVDVGVEEDEEGVPYSKSLRERFSKTPSVMNLEPCARVALSWNDVVLKVTDHDHKNEKEILSHVSGFVHPGQLVFILGASGAGKTSCLNVLARRNTKNTGEVLINGVPFTEEAARMTAYVQQEDLFLGSLTVEEHLGFQARLTLPHLSDQERRKRVEQLINSLMLTKCRSRLIGSVQQNLSRGISGGERKRLAFASEIITDPSLVLADEPTSGLDSYMAENVCVALRQLAESGRTVVATIHQPSSDVYSLAHSVIFLAEGRIAYSGSREGAIEYFSNIGYECPTYNNPADYFIRVLAKRPSKSLNADEKARHEEAEHKRLSDICDKWDEHVKSGALEEDTRILKSESTGDVEDLARHRRQRAAWCTQFSVLTQRAFKNTLRDPVTTRARLGQAVVVGLIVGLIYWQLGQEQADVQNRNGALFFVLINQSMNAMFGVLQVFPLERPIFQREVENGTYSPSAYFWAKILSDLPSQLVPNTILVTLAWFLTRMRVLDDGGADVGAFFTFLALITLTANSAISLGYLISSLVPSITVALAVGPLVILPFMLFAGFFVNVDSIPVGFQWLEVLSFFKYAFSSGAITIWKDVELNCPTAPGARCAFHNGNEVIEGLSLDPDDMLRDFLALAIMVVGYRILAFLALKWRTTHKQNE